MKKISDGVLENLLYMMSQRAFIPHSHSGSEPTLRQLFMDWLRPSENHRLLLPLQKMWKRGSCGRHSVMKGGLRGGGIYLRPITRRFYIVLLQLQVKMTLIMKNTARK